MPAPGPGVTSGQLSGASSMQVKLERFDAMIATYLTSLPFCPFGDDPKQYTLRWQ